MDVFPGPVPREALAYFRAKGYQVGFDHRDVWRQEHAHAFTVAKAMTLDLLRDIREAVDAALAEGKTYREFARELTPILQARGWWGRAEMTDPVTGQPVLAQLGSPRRLQTIYRVNLRTARAAGQWERIQRTKALLPYLLYRLGPSREHRPEHRRWNGLILPADHPWWAVHYPPNGWGCKCHVRQISRREYQRLADSGGTLTEPPDLGPDREWTNKRTGAVERVAPGIDPGWDYHPGAGRARRLAQQVAAKLAQAHPADVAALSDTATT